MSKTDNIPLEAVLNDKEIVYHPTREGRIFEAIFDKSRGLLIERNRPFREFTSATAFVHGHVTTKHNGRHVCRVLRNGVEYRLEDLFKPELQQTTKEMPPSTSKKIPVPIKGLIPVKQTESIIATCKESDKPPIELTSVSIVKLIPYMWMGSNYWFDETNKKLYAIHASGGVGDYVGELNEAGSLTFG